MRSNKRYYRVQLIAYDIAHKLSFWPALRIPTPMPTPRPFSSSPALRSLPPCVLKRRLPRKIYLLPTPPATDDEAITAPFLNSSV